MKQYVKIVNLDKLTKEQKEWHIPIYLQEEIKRISGCENTSENTIYVSFDKPVHYDFKIMTEWESLDDRVKWNMLPEFIRKKMLYYQHRHYGVEDKFVFINNILSASYEGGFNWKITPEGFIFWDLILKYGWMPMRKTSTIKIF